MYHNFRTKNRFNGQTLNTRKKMVSAHMVSFCNTFTVMVQARLSVKDNAGGDAIYKFSYVPHLLFYMTSQGINMEGKYKGLQSTHLHNTTLIRLRQ